MAVQQEIWKPEIIGQLYAENAFLDKCTRADEHVLQGKVVHIPQGGANVGVARNRTVYPLPISRRADSDIVYVLEEYSSEQFVVPNIDLLQLSYDKRKSLIEDNTGNMFDIIGQNVLYNWTKNVPVANMINVTGAAGTSTDPTKRKLLTAEIEKAAKMFDDQLIKTSERYLMLTSAMYYDLLGDPAIKGYFQQIMNMKTGEMPEYFGFKIMMRPTTMRLTAAGVPILPETAAAGTDVPGAIFWQKNAVESAMGDVKMFELLGDPAQQGDVYSMLMMLGGRNRRADNKGVGIIRHIP